MLAIPLSLYSLICAMKWKGNLGEELVVCFLRFSLLHFHWNLGLKVLFPKAVWKSLSNSFPPKDVSAAPLLPFQGAVWESFKVKCTRTSSSRCPEAQLDSSTRQNWWLMSKFCLTGVLHKSRDCQGRAQCPARRWGTAMALINLILNITSQNANLVPSLSTWPVLLVLTDSQSIPAYVRAVNCYSGGSGKKRFQIRISGRQPLPR